MDIKEWDNVKHGLLVGNYDLTLDEKYRLLIPSDIRRAIDKERDGEGFYIITGINKKPWIYSEKVYDELSEDRRSQVFPGAQSRKLDALSYGQAQYLTIDKQHRVLIPEKYRKRAGIEHDITLVGMRDHCELWLRHEWTAYELELEKYLEELESGSAQTPPAAANPAS